MYYFIKVSLRGGSRSHLINLKNKYSKLSFATLITILVTVFHYQIDDLNWKIKHFIKLSQVAKTKCEGTTTQAQVMRPFNVERAYPKLALDKEIEGKISMALAINEKGYVTSADIIEAYPSGLFETAATSVAKRMLYYPATNNCKATPSTAKLTVMYKLDD